MKKLALALLLLLLSCDTPTLPTPPTIPDPQPPAPPQRVDAPFSWAAYRGDSAFALVGYDEGHIERIIREGLARGFNTPRVCAETEYWDDSGFLKRVPRDIQAVRRLLETAARIEGAQVLLVADCTLKGPVPIPEQKEWIREVARLVQREQYQNVAVQVWNESWNCRGRGWGDHCPSRGDVIDMIRTVRQHGIQYVGDDDHICIGEADVPHRVTGEATFYAFHPCREVNGKPWDPDVSFLRRMVAANPGAPVVLDETVAYSETECRGLRTCDKERIYRYRAAAREAGVPWTFHADYGLEAREFPWWP